METTIRLHLAIANLWPLLLILPLLIALLFNKKIKASKVSQISVFAAICVVGYFTYGTFSNTVRYESDKLTVSAGGFSKTFSIKPQCVKQAVIKEDHGYSLSYKVAGTAFANYRAGHFTTNKGKAVFVLATGNTKTASLYQFPEGLLLIEDSEQVKSLMDKLCSVNYPLLQPMP